MTSITGTIATPMARSGRAGPLAQRTLRGIAGRVGVAFCAIRESVAAAQLGPGEQLESSRWAGARA